MSFYDRLKPISFNPFGSNNSSEFFSIPKYRENSSITDCYSLFLEMKGCDGYGF